MNFDQIKKRFKEAIWSLLIEKILDYFFILLISVGLIGGLLKIILLATGIPVSCHPYIIIFICGLSGLVILDKHSKYDRHRPKMPRIDCDFHISKQNTQYEYLDDTRMVYTRIMTLRALKDNLTNFPGKYTWTGSGEVFAECSINGQAYTPRKLLNSDQTPYSISFEKVLMKSDPDPTNVHFRLNFNDTGHKAQTFLSVTIRYPTDALTMVVKLPNKFRGQKAFFEMKLHSCMETPVLPPETLTFDENGIVTKTISDPRLLWRYIIYWHFPA